METSRAEGKRSSRHKKEESEEDEEEEVEEDNDDEEEEEEEEDTESEVGSGEEHGRKRRVISNTHNSGRHPKQGSSSTAAPPCCQADDCRTDLTGAKTYHRRHKVCEHHSKAPAVLVSGKEQRFCQQCSRFHELPEFDNAKRSCRRRLAGHNERRRKVSSD